MTTDEKRTIVVLSTFPPRECGLAKFASHLTDSLEDLYGDSCEVVVAAMERDPGAPLAYPSLVEITISQDDPASYRQAAEAINSRADVRMVHIQHEFGIFGGEFGSHLLHFTEALRKPFVIAFHTVLPEPPEAMRSVVVKLGEQAGRVLAMTEASRNLLVSAFGLSADRIVVVPHDIIPMPFEEPARAKADLGLTGRTTLLNFGLLSQNKGIEYVIEALPGVVSRHPEVLYMVVGVTHPAIQAREGEQYRNMLEARVEALGLTNHVRFYDRFVSDEELQVYLHAADIYVASSLEPNQAVSGTLSYALGSGRPVISTAFAQAKELVTDRVGILVGFRDPAAFTDAINRLLDDPALRARMEREAFASTRWMTRPNVTAQTVRVYADCDSVFDRVAMRPPRVRLDHLERMTDDFGIIQFSDINEPVLATGYTVDDNARALTAVLKYFTRYGDTAALDLARVYLGFLERAGHPASFHGLFGQERLPAPSPSPDDNQEDAKGRLIMSLGTVAAIDGLPPDLHEKAVRLLGEWLTSPLDLKSTRASAFLVIGLVALRHSVGADARLDALITAHCDHLASLHENQRSEGWEWFEPCISYSNGAMCEALIAGGRLFGNSRWLGVGQKTLDFLIQTTFIDRGYVAIGQSNWCSRGAERSFYDQQPEDTATMVSALACMAEADSTGKYAELQRTAFEWFLGRNTLGQFAYNVATGGCYDGLGQHTVNLNQGAESTIAYLQARLLMPEL